MYLEIKQQVLFNWTLRYNIFIFFCEPTVQHVFQINVTLSYPVLGREPKDFSGWKLNNLHSYREVCYFRIIVITK